MGKANENLKFNSFAEMVDVVQLKNFAKTKLANCELTKEFILEEPDRMTPEEFVLKMAVWLKLIRKDLAGGD